MLIYQSSVIASLSSLPEMLLSSFPCIFHWTERMDFLNGHGCQDVELFVGFTWYSRRARLRRFESILKVVLFIGLPVPIILCPVVVIRGNFLAGLGYGLVTPLAVTFKAIGKGMLQTFIFLWILLPVRCMS